jgi:biopolymer transport protein TolR
MRFINGQWIPSARRRRARLHGVMDVSGFAGVMLALLFLMMFGEMYPMHPKSLPVDMAFARHSTSQANAEREDAVIVGIMRDGRLYVMNAVVNPVDLPNVLGEVMARSNDKTVYVKADARAKYGAVKVALDAIRSANVTNIVFLTEPSRR